MGVIRGGDAIGHNSPRRVPLLNIPYPGPGDGHGSPEFSDDPDVETDSDNESDDQNDGSDDYTDDDTDHDHDHDDHAHENDSDRSYEPPHDPDEASPRTTVKNVPPAPTAPPRPNSTAEPHLSTTRDKSSSVPQPTTVLSPPSETSLPGKAGTTESNTASTTGPVATASREPERDFIGDKTDSGTANPGTEVGIILGTIALATFLVLGFIFLYRGIRRRRAQLLGNAFPEGRLSSSDSGHVELVASQMEEQREQQRVYDQSSLGIFNQSSATQEQPSRSYNSGNIRSVAIAAPIGGVISPATSTPTRPTTVYHTHGWETDDHGVSPIDSPLFRPSLGGAASADRNIPEVHLTRASTNEQPAVMHQPPGISRLPISRR